MEETYKVVMLPTQKKSRLVESTLGALSINQSKHLGNRMLYILSNDDIKIGDLTLDLNQIKHGHGGLTTIDNHYELEHYAWSKQHNVKKVIAASETIKIDVYEWINKVDPVIPAILDSAIENFVTEYNLGNPIEDILPEFIHEWAI